MARKRRGRSEGSIFQRADGQWVGSISLGYDGTGKRKRRTVYGGSKKEVQEKLAALRGDALRGILTEPHKTTVGEFLDRWLEDVVRPVRAPNTYRSYEGSI